MLRLMQHACVYARNLHRRQGCSRPAPVLLLCCVQVPRLAVALAPILSLLSEAGGPGWAGGRQLACGACTVLAALLAPSECEAVHQQQVGRRGSLRASLAAGCRV